MTHKRRDAVDGPLLAAYVYDTVALGQLYAAQAYDGAGSVQVETRTTALDDRYRALTQEWIMAGHGVFRMATAYNAADQVTSLTYPADNAGNLGEVVVQGYNGIGQVSEGRGARRMWPPSSTMLVVASRR
jgi:hypothetical protein